MNFGFSHHATDRYGGMARDWSSVSSLGPYVSAAASLGGAALNYLGATNAANTQADAARQAATAAQANLGTTRGDLSPYRVAGTDALNLLMARLPSLSSPINFNQAALEATPGYKFTRDQGLKSVQSAAAAKGLGISGAALKGAADFATGLADNTVQSNFARELASRQNEYNMLTGVVGTGENAAAQTGQFGTANTGQLNAANLAGANASAAGQIGGTNAGANALTGGVNNYLQYSLLNRLISGGGGTGSGSGDGFTPNGTTYNGQWVPY